MQLGLKHNKKIFLIDADECSWLRKFSGLMFKRKENARALLFDFSDKTKIAIHSWFVFFPFLAIWIDDKNRIIDIKNIKPFSFNIRPKNPYKKLVEIPINSKYKDFVQFLVEKQKHLKR
ncbi:MAG TPA: DUF192 domain-containing protein [Candidatus Nanoarchaeia archaeon]|nr:DUF192 domain-containing protein [Candidatus Nanoarchaeia archaeon]